ncbi:MAG: zinc finger domain-containing protein, partial [Leptonema sp. (in: bacteria)]
RPIKIVLMDQTKIAGIGNIYANEALFLAKINPQKPANKLTKEEIKRLKNSILKILKKALKYEGTSTRFYLKPDQTKGKYQENFLVYQREGKSCLRCNGKIKKIILGRRSTFYCPNCPK